MKKLKKIFHKLLFPPFFVVILCAVCTVAALTYIFKNNLNDTVVAYFVYVFSAYSFCILLACLIPGSVNGVKNTLSKIPVMNKYLNDRLFRAQVSIYISLISNTIYSVIYAVAAFIQQSYWLMALAFYNFVLTGMRFMLAKNYRSIRKKQDDNVRMMFEYKSYRFCGVLMLIMSCTMTGLIELLISDGKNASGEIMTITIAAYTFYCFIIAIVNVFKFRKQDSPILLASKNVCFARALMSLFSLQITMFSQFDSSNNSSMQYIMNIALGMVVCIVCVVMAVTMIVKANQNIKLQKEGNDYGKE